MMCLDNKWTVEKHRGAVCRYHNCIWPAYHQFGGNLIRNYNICHIIFNRSGVLDTEEEEAMGANTT